MSVDKKKPAKNKGGRPSYQPNEKHYAIVHALCCFGANHRYIAQKIGISANTLRKHYRKLLDECHEQRNDEVEKSLFLNATVRSDFRAQAYWLENHARDRYGNTTVDTQQESSEDILKQLVDHLPD